MFLLVALHYLWRKNVLLDEAADKRAITAIFAQTIDGSFLPMHLIYKGKTSSHSQMGLALVQMKNILETDESIKYRKEEKGQ